MAEAEVVVIGAGAAGILAAWHAASQGARVVLVEKTNRIGTKISISGGGKCNVAHAGPLEEVLRAFRQNEARFIRPACYRFPNDRIVEMLNDRGLELTTRPDGRVFPTTGTAKDVVAILRSYLDEAGVEVRLSTPVEGIEAVDGQVTGVRLGEAYAAHVGYRTSSPGGYGAKALLREVLTESQQGARLSSQKGEPFLWCRHVVLAVGGSSYPNSGTTGDGYTWARELGHTVERVRAALAPIYLHLDPEPPEDRAGIALRNCLLRARLNGKEIAKWVGDLLFTHQGISGPNALGVSRVVAERQGEGEVTLEVDLAMADNFEELSSTLVRYANDHPRRQVASFLDGRVPERLVEAVLSAAQIDPETLFARLDKRSRNRLVNVLKGWPLGKVRSVPLEKGEVVAGGVSLDEVDPQTMRSRCVEGLYLCGEVLDVAGPVGGYNLQAAFATGFVAGETAALDVLADKVREQRVN